MITNDGEECAELNLGLMTEVGMIYHVLYYILSHPENNHDITERAKGYTLQDTSFMRQSRDYFLTREKTQVARDNKHFSFEYVLT